MRKLVNVNDIYTDCFGETVIPMLEVPFIGFAQEQIDYNIPPEQTSYFKWLETKLHESGEVWGRIRTKEDIVTRVNKFENLIKNIKTYGYRPELDAPLFIRGNKIYGSLTAYEKGDKVYLVDGHHRISIMVALGEINIPLTITEEPIIIKQNEDITISSTAE